MSRAETREQRWAWWMAQPIEDVRDALSQLPANDWTASILREVLAEHSANSA